MENSDTQPKHGNDPDQSNGVGCQQDAGSDLEFDRSTPIMNAAMDWSDRRDLLAMIGKLELERNEARAMLRCAWNHLSVWRVRYDCRFESSSGMDQYHIEHKDCDAIVVTCEETLDAVRVAISKTLGNQTRLCVLHEAHYLGNASFNPNTGAQATTPARHQQTKGTESHE